MLGRLIFAGIGVTIFLTSLLSGLLGGYSVLVVVVFAEASILAIRLLKVSQREALARVLRPVLGVFLRTNNRWLLTMVGLTIISFTLAIFTKPGSPVIKTRVQQVMAQGESQRLQEISQRYHNLYFRGEFKTDTELGKPAPTAPPPRSWTGWWIRWTSCLLLLLLTIGYIPFAFSDEVRAAYHRAERHFAERAGGETVIGESMLRRFLQHLLGIEEAAHPATPAGGTPPAAATPAPPPEATAATTRALGGGKNWMTVFLVALLAEVLGERLFERRAT